MEYLAKKNQKKEELERLLIKASNALCNIKHFECFYLPCKKIIRILDQDPTLTKESTLFSSNGLQIVDIFDCNLYLKFQTGKRMIAMQVSEGFQTATYEKICHVRPTEEVSGGVTYCNSILLKKVISWNDYNLWYVLSGNERKLAAVKTTK